MPGFATSEGTKGNAWALMRALGVAGDEIDIRPAAEQMLKDMRHPYAEGKPAYDVTFENVQAGLRTDYLFRLANQHNGLVVGTGDLSELALGWCTYGVGDQMSHYAVNAGVPKTLIQFLIRWCIRTDQYDAETDRVLDAILGQEISPELVPAGADGAMQSTEEQGRAHTRSTTSSRITSSATAWRRRRSRSWRSRRGKMPSGAAGRAIFRRRRATAYDLPTIRGWLEKFLFRFFTISQFKRSAIPNGPKVSAGGALSPRGDWRAPSDGTAKPFLDELKANLP